MSLMLKETIINVGMATIATTKQPGIILSSPGLGSCLGVSIYDPKLKIAGLVHIVLPDSSIAKPGAPLGKYVDTAIPEILRQMFELGARKNNLIIKVAGGAKMFELNNKSSFNIGQRNYEALLQTVQNIGLRIANSDVGGVEGRTVKLYTLDGRVTVRTISKKEYIL